MIGKKDRDTNDIGVSIPTFYKCGKTGIRTLGTVARSPHFECGPIDHSGISPLVFRSFRSANIVIILQNHTFFEKKQKKSYFFLVSRLQSPVKGPS